MYLALRCEGLSVDTTVVDDDPSSNLLVALVMVLNFHVAGRDVVLC